MKKNIHRATLSHAPDANPWVFQVLDRLYLVRVDHQAIAILVCPCNNLYLYPCIGISVYSRHQADIRHLDISPGQTGGQGHACYVTLAGG